MNKLKLRKLILVFKLIEWENTIKILDTLYEH